MKIKFWDFLNFDRYKLEFAAPDGRLPGKTNTSSKSMVYEYNLNDLMDECVDFKLKKSTQNDFNKMIKECAINFSKALDICKTKLNIVDVVVGEKEVKFRLSENSYVINYYLWQLYKRLGNQKEAKLREEMYNYLKPNSK